MKRQRDGEAVYLILLRAEPSCCGDLFQLCRRLLPEDSLQQDKDVCRLGGRLQQYYQTAIPKTNVQTDVFTFVIFKTSRTANFK